MASRRAAEAESRKIQINRKITRARGTTRTADKMPRGLTRGAKETGQKTETRTRAGIGRKTRPEKRNVSERRRRTATRTRRRSEIKKGIRKENGNLTKTEIENETKIEIASARNEGREKKRKRRSRRTEAIERFAHQIL